MIRKFTALLAAFAFAAVSLAPAAADARDRRGYYDRGYHGGHYGRRHHDDGDAVAAGVIGLVLGVAVGSMLAQPREPRVQCYDNYQRCAPPPPRDSYYDRGYEQQGYDPRHEDDYSAYESEYGLEGGPEGSYDPYVERAPQCTRQERQWDRYANRYVTVDVAC